MPASLDSTQSASDSSQQPHSDDAYRISPLHVVVVGAGALGSGVLVTAALSYKQAAKQLAADGIDPRMRSVILPFALKALAGSLFLTGCVGAAGFVGMQSLGLVRSKEAALPSMREAWQLLVGPPGMARERQASKQAAQQQQQQEQQQRQ